MSRTYDNWDRLVEATLRREEDRRVTGIPSDLSTCSLSSSLSLNLSSQHGSSSDFSSLLLGTSYTYAQILEATDSLSKSNLIKHGHSGYLYFGVLEGDVKVVIKKIDRSAAGKGNCYESKLEFLIDVSHPRMVPLLGNCLDNIQLKFLVYRYMPNEDLSRYLYRKSVVDLDADCRQFSPLDWRTRLKIAIGAAEGLCYLHHKCVPPLAHRDVQPSSILLDDDFEPRLGSLSAVCEASARVAEENWIAKFLRQQTGNGRESKGEANATCAHDVYCFGKVLFQLLTGRLQVDSAAGNSPETASPLCLANNWKDLMLQIYDEKRIRSVLDPVLTVQDDVFLEVWAVALVALACLNPKPSRRPKMVQVLKGIRNRKISESFCLEITRAIEAHRTFLGPISPKFFK